MTIAALLLVLLCGGYGLRGWRIARHSALLNDAIRAGVGRLYAHDLPDGRSAARLPAGRYEPGE